MRVADLRPCLERTLRILPRPPAVQVLSLVSRIVAVLLLPVYTHYLTPADYGKIETLIALSIAYVAVTVMV